MSPANNLDLKSLRRWMLFEVEPQADGSVKKKPSDVTGNGRASCNNPETWTTYEEAQRLRATNPEGFRLGFALGKEVGLVVVDIDKARPTKESPWPAWVLQLERELNTFGEDSTSGLGRHFWMWGSIPSNLNRKPVEIYDSNKQFIVSDEFADATFAPLPAGLWERVDEGKIGPDAAPGIVLHLDSEKYRRAVADDLSDFSGDRSRAVGSVLVTLARKHSYDPVKMRAEFEATKLCASMKPGKWERVGDDEIAGAIAKAKVYDAGKPAAAPKPKAIWRVERYAGVTAKPIRWLWPGYLAEGKLTTINGEPGHGKSLITLDVAARVTTGRNFPDGTVNKIGPADVLLLTLEEDAEDTIKPRFLAAGGDVDRLLRVTIDGRAAGFNIEESREDLRQLFQAHPVKLVILDPLMDFTRVEQNKDKDVREVLNTLVDVAREFNFAAAGVNHLNKKSDLDAMHRVAGARGWTSVARLNFLVGKGDDPAVRHLCNLKMNLAADDQGSLDFSIATMDVTDGFILAESYPVLKWLGRGNATANSITQVKQATNTKDRAEQVVWLRDNLQPAGEWKPAAQLLTAAKARGFSDYAMRAARDILGVQIQRTGTLPARVNWRLPEPDKLMEAADVFTVQ